MRVRQVRHVDVVADRGPVGGREIGTVDIDRGVSSSAARIASGIRCVSGSWSSPASPSGDAPAALKYRSDTLRRP